MSEEHESKGEELPARGLDQTRIDETVTQGFEPAPMLWGPAADGLPVPEIKQALPIVPPLSLKTFVCLGDESEFVIRDKWGEVRARFRPSAVSRAAGGGWYVSVEEALVSGAPLRVLFSLADLFSGRVAVEPIRPQCTHLRQQMVDFGADTGAQLLERLCTARRDDESFFVGLRDTQVHACELREPRDPVSEERIRIMNDTKIRLGAERLKEETETFDVDEALKERHDEAMKTGLRRDGIF